MCCVGTTFFQAMLYWELIFLVLVLFYPASATSQCTCSRLIDMHFFWIICNRRTRCVVSETVPRAKWSVCLTASKSRRAGRVWGHQQGRSKWRRVASSALAPLEHLPPAGGENSGTRTVLVLHRNYLSFPRGVRLAVVEKGSVWENFW